MIVLLISGLKGASGMMAKTEIIDYIIGYYSQIRPHQHNDGLAPNVAEEKHWIEY